MIKLPPLPAPYSGLASNIVEMIRTRDLEIARVVLEAAAKVCDGLHWTWHMGDNSGPKDCATKIRSLEFTHD